RYSNGAPVRASDIRRGIERALHLSSTATVWFSGIRGWQDCRARPARCDLSAGIVTDDRRGTVVFHLAAPDPDFPSKLALPQASATPPGAPTHDVGRRPIPATGPYRIATYRPGHELRLLRNPDFRQWSADAQPDGYPDEIVWKLGVDPHRGITAVEHDRAD